MDYSNIPNAAKQYNRSNQDQDQLYDLQVQSDILLSKISFEDGAPESPQINVTTAEAKIKELSRTAAEHQPYKKSKPFCGCGQFYSCTSSLYLHIRSKHKGLAPVGTIGGPKGIVKKPCQDQTDIVKVEEDPDNRGYFANQPKIIRPITQSINNPGLQINNSQHSRSRRREEQGPKSCKLCGKTYSCNSSLNLHLKRKHQMRKHLDGRTEVSQLKEDRIQRNFQCQICGLNYASKSALGLHFNNKHISKTKNNNNEQNVSYDQNGIQKCGCGLVYQSRSALNMHVKKKHDGQYPEGTSKKPVVRQSTTSSLQNMNNKIERYLTKQITSSQENQQSIYDSDSEERNASKSKSKQQPHKNIEEQRQNQEQVPEDAKPYKCGCGRNYSCSSSLNLHIKKNHNWVVPPGTIGGPRGMRSDQENKLQPKFPEQEVTKQKSQQCSACGKLVANSSYFRCKNCPSHILCSNCFWDCNNFSNDHEWVVKQANSSQ